MGKRRVNPGRASRVALLLCAVGAASGAWWLHMEECCGTAPVLDAAVVYIQRMAPSSDAAEYVGDSAELVYIRPGRQARQVVLLSSWPLSSFTPVPDVLGMLPSPDGRWVIAWVPHLPWSRRGHVTATTDWMAIRLEDGKLVRLGETAVTLDEGQPLLPYWPDVEHVALEGTCGTSTFVLAAGKQSPAQDAAVRPMWGRCLDGVTVATVEQFLNAHFSRELSQYRAALAKHGPALGMGDVSRWRRQWSLWRDEWPFALPLGIPLPEEVRDPVGRPMAGWPHIEIACSPDGGEIARADEGIHQSVRHLKPNGRSEEAGARLTVFDADSGKHLWETRIRPRSVEYPMGYPMTNPPMPLYTSPQIRDIRWSEDGHYLSFTLYDDPAPSVIVIETTTWKEAKRIPNAMNAFVLPPRK
jgi:hypothetical protein